MLPLPARFDQHPRLSLDGKWIVVDTADSLDLWIYDLERQTLQRLTVDPGQNRGGLWSPDGQRVAFTREIDGTEEIYWQAADGSGTPEMLTRDSATAVMPRDISRDGSTLFYGRATSDEIWSVPTDGAPNTGTLLIGTSFRETNQTLSPDGRWLAYESDESGRNEIYVRPYPDVDAGGRWLVSTDGGARPLWRRDGGELFYLTFDGPMTTIWAVGVEQDTTFRFGSPRALFNYRYTPSNSGRLVYDVSPDGSLFLVVKAIDLQDDAEPQRMIVVENWFTELERLAPTQ